MSELSSPAAPASVPRMTIYSFLGAMMFPVCSSAPTPLYHLYQEIFHLSPAMITLIFGSYAFALLAALLTLGGLSDYVGRRPLILVSLIVNAVSLLIFAQAQSGETLLIARVVQGFATGMALPTFGAAILDSDRSRGPFLNSITAFLGLTIGTLATGALVAYAPDPTHLIYELLLGITITGIFVLPFMPETTAGRPGAIASMRPQLSVPRRARSMLLRVSPVNIAGWALGGFYLSLMPTLVAIATGITSPFVGGAVVATLMLSATASIILFRTWKPQKVLVAGTTALVAGVAITLAGVGLQQVGLLFLGTAVAGLGFGSIFANILRILLPLAEGHERAELFSAFLVESYLAFALPAIAAGLAAPALGLSVTAYVYGSVIILLAAISLLATRNGVTEHAAAH